MSSCSRTFEDRRTSSASALQAFGGEVLAGSSGAPYRTVHEGKRGAPTIFTIGYEKRDGNDLVASLRDAGVDSLVDVREKPFSRKPDFRRGPLQARCEESGIEYTSWTRLGSTAKQREIHASGEIGLFMSRFRDFAQRRRAEEVDELASFAQGRSIALICYERDHADCHRCVIADLLAERIGATIIAIQ